MPHGDRIRIHGHLASASDTMRGPAVPADLTDVLYLQEETQAGVWVNLTSTDCYPDEDFDLAFSSAISATMTLRVYAPETALYVSVTSQEFSVVVL